MLLATHLPQRSSVRPWPRPWLIALLLLLVAMPFQFANSQETKRAETADLLVTGGQMFDVHQGEMVANKGIAIRDGKFVAVEGFDGVAKKTIELQEGEFILPGLIDCHAHYNVKLIRKRREEFLVMPIIYLANGATVTFSCGEFAPEAMMKMRKRIESGEQVGPRLITSGPYFGRARPGWRRGKTKQEIFDEVDFWAKQGSGGFKAKAIDGESLKYLIERAHHHGLTVTGHLDSGFRGSVNPRDAVEMGIDRIEHFIGGDAMPDTRSAYSSLGAISAQMPEYQKAAKQFIETKTVFDATLTAYGYFGSPREEYEYWIDEGQFFTPFIQDRVKKRKPPKPSPVFEKIYEAKQKTIGEFHKLGGTITLGTDHVSDGRHLPGFGVHREMDAFVRSGIPAADALKIATINGARALKIDKDHGSIENGKSADLVVVKGNPLENIRNTRNVKTVVAGGKVYDAAKLLESVKGKLGPKSEEEMKDW